MSTRIPTEQRRHRWRDVIEFSFAWLVLNLLGLLPLRAAQRMGEWIGLAVHRSWKKLDRIGLRNLELAFPTLTPLQRAIILRQVFKNLGRQLGEFSQFPKLHAGNIHELVEYEGLEHYLEAKRMGRGVLILTGHVGSWELSSYAHSLLGHRMNFLTRPLDNRMLELLIDRYRCRGGNRSIDKKESVRKVVTALKSGETVGILMDLNTQEHEGIFCDFFGIPACTSPILARLAARFEVPVVPGFLIWDPARRKHILKFDPHIPLIHTGDVELDAIKNTEIHNAIIARHIRNFPDQWFWVHKRWHTRPAGEAPFYPSS